MDALLPPAPQGDHFHNVGLVVPINPPVEVKEEDEKGKGRAVEEPPTTWTDIALSIAAELMQACRAEVKKRLDYTVSAGIARNKVYFPWSVCPYAYISFDRAWRS